MLQKLSLVLHHVIFLSFLPCFLPLDCLFLQISRILFSLHADYAGSFFSSRRLRGLRRFISSHGWSRVPSSFHADYADYADFFFHTDGRGFLLLFTRISRISQINFFTRMVAGSFFFSRGLRGLGRFSFFTRMVTDYHGFSFFTRISQMEIRKGRMPGGRAESPART